MAPIIRDQEGRLQTEQGCISFQHTEQIKSNLIKKQSQFYHFEKVHGRFMVVTTLYTYRFTK